MPNIYRKKKKMNLNEILPNKEKVYCKLLTVEYLSCMYDLFKRPGLKEYLQLRKWPEEDIKSRLLEGIRDRSQLTSYLFLKNHSPIGLGQYYPASSFYVLKNNLSNDQLVDAAGLDFFIVYKEIYQNGIATKMLNHLLDQIGENHEKCWAAVPTGNVEVIECLKQVGFMLYSEIVIAKEHKNLQIILMVKTYGF